MRGSLYETIFAQNQQKEENKDKHQFSNRFVVFID